MRLQENTPQYIKNNLGINDKIYCFGAGNFGKMFLEDPLFSDLHSQTIMFVDNDDTKVGKFIELDGHKYSVISVKELLQQIRVDDVIVVTCKDYISILRQLNTLSDLEQTVCYVYSALKDYIYDIKVSKVYVPDNLRICRHAMIPKTIHYCWFGKNKLSKDSLLWMKSWKKYNPDYEIIEWNEDNYNVNKNRYMKQAYENQKWAFVSDYARLDILYQYGGVYLDTDVEITKSIDDLLYQKGFCGFQNYNEVNFGLAVGAVKENPLIKMVLDSYENMDFYCNDGQLNMTPCPIIQSSVLEKYGFDMDGSYQSLEDMTVYPERVLSGKSQKTRKVCISDKTYAVHHFNASWMNKKDYLERKKRDSIINEYTNLLYNQ